MVLLGDRAAGAAVFPCPHPRMNAGPMDCETFCEGGCAPEFPDYGRCWFHSRYTRRDFRATSTPLTRFSDATAFFWRVIRVS